MRSLQVAVLLLGFGGVGLVPSAGCGGKDCSTTDCDYTHITVSFVDTSGDASEATTVTYMLTAAYNDDGTVMSDSQLSDAGIDLTEVHDAVCASRDTDTNTCATWVLASGFATYAISAELDDSDGTFEDSTTLTVDLTVPTSSPHESCCGLVNSDAETMTLDSSGSGDTGDTGGDTGA